MIAETKFYSKLLLFGEYTIIGGGNALSMPLRDFSGHWTKSALKSDLLPFFEHLDTLEGYNGSTISQAKAENWIFEADIPQGYGLGSSGALTAAAFDAFYKEKDLEKIFIRKALASAESFFHGSSSGLDPMTSYFNKPILVKEDKVTVLDKIDIGHSFLLIDSEKERDSKTLINWFNAKKESTPQFKVALERLNELNQIAIDSILCSNTAGIEKAMKEISTLQFNYFKKLIPDHIIETWSKGLSEDSYYLKLSGAGGGGYFLAYGANEELKQKFKTISLG